MIDTGSEWTSTGYERRWAAERSAEVGLRAGRGDERLTEVHGPPGKAQLSLSVRWMTSSASSLLTTTTFADGTTLFAAGACGSS
ncbi:MAG: hypothetical protein ACRDSL_23720 [Pseudonocardiaceae bacterium]